MNVDLQIISKPLSAKLKKFDQIWYSHNKQPMLWTDILAKFGVSKIKIIEGFLVTVDIEKASDSLDHNFLIFALENAAVIGFLSYG